MGPHPRSRLLRKLSVPRGLRPRPTRQAAQGPHPRSRLLRKLSGQEPRAVRRRRQLARVDGAEQPVAERGDHAVAEIEDERLANIIKIDAVSRTILDEPAEVFLFPAKHYVTEAVNEYTAEWVIEAMRAASKANAHNWKYVEAVLKRWKVDGFQSSKKKETPAFVPVKVYE